MPLLLVFVKLVSIYDIKTTLAMLILNPRFVHRSGEAVPGALKQKNMAAAAQGRNRKALGDIGNNVVTVRGVEGKPLPQRPITRSFCAQLLANAQAAAENQKV